jgi:hypothetical protein
MVVGGAMIYLFISCTISIGSEEELDEEWMEEEEELDCRLGLGFWRGWQVRQARWQWTETFSLPSNWRDARGQPERK